MRLQIGREELNARMLRSLDERLTRIETQLGLEPMPMEDLLHGAEPRLSESNPLRIERVPGQDLEYEIGRNWFGLLGVLVLLAGMLFTLSRPFEGIPSITAPAAGYLMVLVFAGLSIWFRDRFRRMSLYCISAACVLLLFSTIRLFFFGEVALLETGTFPGRLALLLAVAAILLTGLKRESRFVLILGIFSVLLVGIIDGADALVLASAMIASGLLATVQVRKDWAVVMAAGVPLVYIGLAIWVMGNPVLGNSLRLDHETARMAWILPLCMLILSTGPYLKPAERNEDSLTILFVCGLGFPLFLFQTLVLTTALFTIYHLLMALVLISISAAFWTRHQSRFSVFVYAMTGYLALSAAILKVVSPPDVFVWLSLQSLVVLTTAIWFRSPFIVVANFLIFIAVFVGYMATVRLETGLSIGFGIVALVSARILNWKRDRLTLKTELMRNAYLVSAFFIFPYAIYHLVPSALVGIGWAGVALAYYGLYFIFHNKKYRWMAHGTLVLVAVYLIFFGIRQLDPIYRNVSLLVLGLILFTVSMIFARSRTRDGHHTGPGSTPGE